MSFVTLREVLIEWDAVARRAEALSSGQAVALARGALQFGHPSLAVELLEQSVQCPNASAEARYLAALAQARSGGYRAAARLVSGLLKDPAAGAQRVDALALAGRIAKDHWARLPDGDERRQAGLRAVEHYSAAWAVAGDPFPGINAASLLALLGEREASQRLAREVRRVAADRDPDRWSEATQGEAALLLDEPEQAAAHYAAARRWAGSAVGDIASMRRQLRLLTPVADVGGALSALSMPSVVVFTGHMIDAPGRAEARFPADIEGPVAAAIAAALERIDAGFGYGSAACGADLLFAEALLARGAELHLTLPFDRADFLLTSVAHAGSAWIERFDRVLQSASSLSYGVRERFLGDEALFAYASGLIQGAALQRASELEAAASMLAVCDATAVGSVGGTRATLEHWRRFSLPCEIIDLAPLRAQGGPATVHASAPPPLDAPVRGAALRRAVRSMLFADMVGYSRLGEEDTPAFLLNFVGAVAEVVHAAGRPPEFINTWGDGLFMVFEDVLEAAEFALTLRDAVLSTDWTPRGLPASTSIRIGMHTGPVFPAIDPLIERRNYFGTHVNRAARIEPVATPGAVFVSAEMAFTLAASGSSRFVTEYLGMLPLAKGFGASPLYRLRRSAESE